MVPSFNHQFIIDVPLPMRPEADFRGTITYASLNAHLKLVRMIVFNRNRTYREEMIFGVIIL